MIPSPDTKLNGDIEFVEQSSYTFYLDINNNVVFGYTDSREAMKQAIYLILETERYQWVILSGNYGVEFKDLFGMPISWVIPEVKRRIQDALLHDTRIKSVENFEFEVLRGKLLVAFTARTIFGDIPIEKEVRT